MQHASARYADLLPLPRHISPSRTPMPTADRAAQFAPFAALTGFDAAIQETARLTDSYTEPSEDEKQVLNETLLLLAAALADHPQATITYFQPDPYKSGGTYHTLTGHVRKIDLTARTLCLVESSPIPLDAIRDIQCDQLFTTIEPSL